MTLDRLPPGVSAKIEALEPSLNGGVRRRLEEIGFRASARVQCLVVPAWGSPHVFSIGGSIYSLEAEVAQKIRVHREEPGASE